MLQYLLSLTILSTIVSAISAHNNVALYWGQNSARTQTSLASYCESESADIYILSFVHIFGDRFGINANFANACSDTFSNGLLHCPTIAEDIKKCQSMGKTILLSLGGASGAYGFSSDEEGERYAETLWNMFGAGSDSSVERPFDDAIVDGFDFDIENNVPTGYAALATKLRTYFEKDTSKRYYLSAAPQCPYPDASVGDLMANAYIDFAFIQFYNNYCSTLGSNFNWNIWTDYAKAVSPNKDIQMFIGLPAAPGAAGSGYATIDHVKDVFTNDVLGKDDSNFAGFVLWDASWSRTNSVNGKSFGNNLQDIVDAAYDSNIPAPPQPSSYTTDKPTTDAPTTQPTTSSTSETTTQSNTDVPTSSTSSKTEESTSTTSSTTEATTSSTTEATTSSTTTPTATPTITPTTTSSTQGVDVPELTTLKTVTKPDDKNQKVTTTSSAPNETTTPTTAPTNVPTNCSGLSGNSKAQCLNARFAAGLFLNGNECNEGDLACSSNGSFAICNFGKWVEMQCAAGTTCYAYDFSGQVDIGCNYINEKVKYEKRELSDTILSLFKRFF